MGGHKAPTSRRVLNFRIKGSHVSHGLVQWGIKVPVLSTIPDYNHLLLLSPWFIPTKYPGKITTKKDEWCCVARCLVFFSDVLLAYSFVCCSSLSCVAIVPNCIQSHYLTCWEETRHTLFSPLHRTYQVWCPSPPPSSFRPFLPSDLYLLIGTVKNGFCCISAPQTPPPPPTPNLRQLLLLTFLLPVKVFGVRPTPSSFPPPHTQLLLSEPQCERAMNS